MDPDLAPNVELKICICGRQQLFIREGDMSYKLKKCRIFVKNQELNSLRISEWHVSLFRDTNMAAVTWSRDFLIRVSLSTLKVQIFFFHFFLQLIQRDFLGSFTMALRVCFLLFEGLRTQLKFQMEVWKTCVQNLCICLISLTGALGHRFQMFFKKLMDILAMDLSSVLYEKRDRKSVV